MRPEALFHADVARYVGIVAYHRQLLVEGGQLGDLFGDEVVMRHRDDRDLKAYPLPDLAGVGAGGVDEHLARERLVVGVDTPGAVDELDRVGDPGVAFHHGSTRPSPGDESGRGAGRVDVAVVGSV